MSVVLALTLVALPASTAYAQPGNDDVADATTVAALPFTDSVDTTDATLEDGEPESSCAPVGATVWYAMTLSQNTSVTVDTAGSDYDTVLSVYQAASSDDFAEVACNDDSVGLQAMVSFAAAAGATYFVQAGAFGDEEFGAGGQLEISFGRGSAKPSLLKGSFRGNQAVAEWFTGEEEVFSDTFLILTDGSSRFGPGRPISEPTLDVFHFSEEFDPETGSFTITDLFGFAHLAPNEFTMDRRLRQASVNVDLTLEGARCEFGEEEFEDCEFLTAEVTVSVSWDGSGETTNSQAILRERGSDFRFMFHDRATGREAVADGSIAGELDLVSGPAEFASLTRASESFMEWSRGG